MKTIHVSNDFEAPAIPVTSGELVKVVHGRKAVIVTFIRSGDRPVLSVVSTQVDQVCVNWDCAHVLAFQLHV